ncbi:MAG: YkgJ family cysteine cluster protein [Bacteroidota bacterium]
MLPHIKSAGTKKILEKLKSCGPHKYAEIIDELHHYAAENYNCLNCAACCKSLGPGISDNDIRRISAFLKLKPSVFTEKYIVTDEDGDFIFRSMPCPFLESDNKCSIYPVRPKACREYPHTHSRQFLKTPAITIKNAAICPVVYWMIEILQQKQNQ